MSAAGGPIAAPALWQVGPRAGSRAHRLQRRVVVHRGDAQRAGQSVRRSLREQTRQRAGERTANKQTRAGGEDAPPDRARSPADLTPRAPARSRTHRARGVRTRATAAPLFLASVRALRSGCTSPPGAQTRTVRVRHRSAHGAAGVRRGRSLWPTGSGRTSRAFRSCRQRAVRA
jgi:hypothetical protein